MLEKLTIDKSGTDKERQEAYYYMGSVYRDLNDYPNAVTNFLKSVEIAETHTDKDCVLWENAYSQLSYLYGMQLNYTEALDIALRQLQIAEVNGTINERTYMNVASYNMAKKDTAPAKYNDQSIKALKGADRVRKRPRDIFGSESRLLCFFFLCQSFCFGLASQLIDSVDSFLFHVSS